MIQSLQSEGQEAKQAEHRIECEVVVLFTFEQATRWPSKSK